MLTLCSMGNQVGFLDEFNKKRDANASLFKYVDFNFYSSTSSNLLVAIRVSIS